LGISGRIFPYPNRFNCVRLILAIYYKMSDELESIDENEDDTFDALNKKLEDERAKEEAQNKAGYSAVPIDENEKHDNPESPNNVLIDGQREIGEDVELE